ncbi:MAG: phosphoribosylanthranilate isomerase [Thermomicrobiales bacterium]|nr:phosphoribosylanthranilate isomerase [Thermomicrobiales bacterium]
MSTQEGIAELYARGSLVKICGLREPEHAVAAAEAGADVLGFIFAPARRQVTAEQAGACIAAARQAKPGILACGVFVDASAAAIAEVVRLAGLDLVQLSGSEVPSFVADLPVPAVKALRPAPGVAAEEILGEISTFRQAPVPPVAFLLDAYSATAAGGTGERVDWGLAAKVGAEMPVMLAGGLDPENVAKAVAQVRPLGVDVSSGVEVEGRKAGERIRAFVSAARAAFAATASP